ncbi:hypothetical protein ACJJTC_018209 [Scirpophaga incertulas]
MAEHKRWSDTKGFGVCKAGGAFKAVLLADLAAGKLRNIEGKEAVGRIVQYTEFYGWLHKNSSAVAKASQQQRRRRSAAGSDVRSILFQVEEERAEREILQNRELADIRSELAGIKAELSQMSGLMREYLNNKNK